MTINFQGSWHCAICQYLLVREFENDETNEMAREHFETINEKSSSEQFYSRTQCDSTSLPFSATMINHGSQTWDL